jgi:hypothetical protein
VKKLGGLTVKLTGKRGLPDRLVLLPGARVAFLELKRPVGGRLSLHQTLWLSALSGLGLVARVCCTCEAVDEALTDLLVR